jgi:hypothetical protein
LRACQGCVGQRFWPKGTDEATKKDGNSSRFARP